MSNKSQIVVGNEKFETNLTLGGALGTGFYTGSTYAVGTLFVTLLAGIGFAGPTAGILLSLSVLVAGLACGILQQIWFNWEGTLRWSYPVRLAWFGVTLFASLAACAWLGGWVPKGNLWAWLIFSLVFLAILAVLTVVIGHSLRRQGVDYKRQLEDYRSRRG